MSFAVIIGWIYGNVLSQKLYAMGLLLLCSFEQFRVSLQIVPDPYLIFCCVLAVSVIILMVGIFGAEIILIFEEHLMLLNTKCHDIGLETSVIYFTHRRNMVIV